MVTLPDGLSPEDGRNDPLKFLLSIKTTMPPKLQKLIEDINGVDGESKISCIVVSMNMGWALEVGRKLGLKGSVLFPCSASTMATCTSIHSLINDGLINAEDGLPTKKHQIQLFPRYA
ncbi:hypothetical protein L6164_007537 [Bauhinia variegata]|uniref:Uncharacterized protein n=1 Tax=Bauhinia variegata TaxID=167791 RepID=A0ACB9PFE9_BAUVA|nr:hypothetical protein L6164_007537 [Bauhinia variegata]